MCKAGTDAPSSGKFLTLPEREKEYAPCPPSNHTSIGAHLGAVLHSATRAKDEPHPLGCHRSRIPDRVVFGKLVQILLVFGCAYERIADESCSESTLRRGRDEWIEP